MFLIDDLLELIGLASTAAPEIATGVGTTLAPEVVGGLGTLGATGEALGTLGGLGSLGSMAPGAGAALYEAAGAIPAVVTEMGPASVSAFTNTLAGGGTQLEAMTAAQSAAATSGITGGVTTSAGGAGTTGGLGSTTTGGLGSTTTGGTSGFMNVSGAGTNSVLPSAGTIYSDAAPGSIVDMGGGQMGTVSNSGAVIPNTTPATQGLTQTANYLNPTGGSGVTQLGSGYTGSNLGGATYNGLGASAPTGGATLGGSYVPSGSNLLTGGSPLASTPQSGGILDSALNFAKDNKFMTGMMAYTAAQKLGLFDPSKQQFNNNSGSPYLSSFRMSPNFQSAPTASAIRPSYTARYAEGGITGMAMGGQPGQMYPQSMQEHTNFAQSTQYPTSAQQVESYEPQTNPLTGELTKNMASGGSTSSKLDANSFNEFLKMASQPSSSSYNFLPHQRSLGVVSDENPNTKYEDAYNAAVIRQAALNKRANMSPTGSNIARQKGLGTLDLGPVGKEKAKVSAAEPDYAAQGGLMGHLGSFAKGGSPRMLKGPGDGMSDSIPATIGDVQPARLADGEFVVPADVVSHLGNGSSDAGAKKLYGMMDKIRTARTGKKKQAPQVNAAKFVPKA